MGRSTNLYDFFIIIREKYKIVKKKSNVYAIIT